MKKKINAGRFLLALMLLTLSLAACGGDQPPPTIVPPTARSTESENEPIDSETESEPTIPAEDPTAEPTEVPADRTVMTTPEGEVKATPVSNDGDMTSTTIELNTLEGPFGSGWLWSSYTDENDTPSEIENPNKYILIFGEDNSLIAVGDCNFASGTYAMEGDQLSAELEPSDLTECEGGSRSAQFLELVALGGSLSIDGDTLTVELPEEAGRLGFIANDPQAAFRVESWEEAAENFLESCDAPGAVMLVDEPGGRFLEAYGLANTEDGTPMQTDDRFEIGSNTKSFTVVLALQLQEEGVWSLDDPLSQWLPDEAARIPNGEAITLRQLASNTSGIWDYADPLIGALIEEGGDLEQAFTPDELIDYVVENGEPSFAPGEGAEYSSTNFILLGEAIEAATGEALADLYQERIFDPLGMENSSLLEGVPEDGAIVNGYYTLPSGEVLNTTDENGSQMWAAGGIISTAEDMAKYTAALSSGSLFQDIDAYIQMTDFGDEFVASFSGYGLGVGKWSDEPFAWGHGGQTAGFQTLFAIFPSSLTNVVLLTNSASCSVSGLMGIIQASPALLPTEEEPMAEGAEAGDTTTNIPDEQLELMAAIAPPPQLSDREPGVDSVSCSPGVLSGNNLIEGEDYYCGIFTVPQNWEEPDGRNLDLSYVVVNATGENPEPDPILYLAGGPGSSAILTKGINKYQKLRPDRDLIIFDTRGLGLSQRLGFEECLVLAMQNDAPADQIEALRTAAPNLVAKVSGEEGVGAPDIADQDLPVLNEICWEQFTAQGLDIDQFSTASNARDAVELIKALGYESFNIDSVSYGTRHAMTIMDDIPGYDDAPQLRSVVLDSTFPPSVYLIRTIVRSDHDFMLQLLEECQADSACNEAYPNLKERLAALLNNLEEAPLTSNGETATLDDVVTQLRDTGGTRAAFLPKMIAELETGVLDSYLALRDGEVGTDPPEAIPMAAPAATEELDPNDPVQAFVAAALNLLSLEEALVFPTYLQLLVLEEDPLAVLPEFIAETYPGETADQMLEISGTLTAEDFANSPYVAQLQAEAAAASDPEAQLVSMREGNVKGMAQLLYSSIHCIDDILNESFEDAVDSYNSLAFPQLTDLDKSQVFADRCENWLVDPALIEVKGPVTSDVRTIILQGAYDKPTPVYMGQTAASELENSTYVYVPQQGHETWRNAESCVGQITAAFVEDPEAALDLSCLESRKPQWVLPNDGGS